MAPVGGGRARPKRPRAPRAWSVVPFSEERALWGGTGTEITRPGLWRLSVDSPCKPNWPPPLPVGGSGVVEGGGAERSRASAMGARASTSRGCPRIGWPLRGRCKAPFSGHSHPQNPRAGDDEACFRRVGKGDWVAIVCTHSRVWPPAAALCLFSPFFGPSFWRARLFSFFWTPAPPPFPTTSVRIGNVFTAGHAPVQNVAYSTAGGQDTDTHCCCRYRKARRGACDLGPPTSEVVVAAGGRASSPVTLPRRHATPPLRGGGGTAQSPPSHPRSGCGAQEGRLVGRSLGTGRPARGSSGLAGRPCREQEPPAAFFFEGEGTKQGATARVDAHALPVVPVSRTSGRGWYVWAAAGAGFMWGRAPPFSPWGSCAALDAEFHLAVLGLVTPHHRGWCG